MNRLLLILPLLQACTPVGTTFKAELSVVVTDSATEEAIANARVQLKTESGPMEEVTNRWGACEFQYEWTFRMEPQKMPSPSEAGGVFPLDLRVTKEGFRPYSLLDSDPAAIEHVSATLDHSPFWGTYYEVEIIRVKLVRN